uniref:Uncharacterized protein n=1 Tax=Oryza sativa subsp. japonica TaxID=39947 RepID=Q5Z5U2_ORYSJ|nr:hypothetical protein [Oryza sativa Japonica Group]
MGQGSSGPVSWDAALAVSYIADVAATCKHMEAGGCKLHLLTALRDCVDKPRWDDDDDDSESVET